MTIRPISDEDLLVWPDGTRCYRSEYARGEYAYLGDDFIVLPADSEEWRAAVSEERA